MVRAKTRERGATLLLVTFVSAFLLLPIIGVCIDGAVLYWVKARLSAAVDASALATARSLSVGQSDAAQLTNALAIGRMYFTANFPAGMMRTKLVGDGPTITINESVVHQRIVNVSVSVNMPLFFMPLLGFQNQTVSASGQATRRDANIMLVLDRSNSMNKNGSCSSLIASAQNFVSQFVDGRDQLGLVTFQFTANVDFSPALSFKSANPSLNSTLGTLICDGDTNTVEGLYNGYDQIKNTINQPGALNVILLFTDGQANSFVGHFEIKDKTDTRYDAINTAQLVSTPPSGCSGSVPLIGVFGDASTETAADVYGLNPTGGTGGVVQNTGVPLTKSADWIDIRAPGCSFYQNGNPGDVRRDIKGLPTQDVHGNSTVDGGYLPLDYFPSGHPYAGYIRPDMPRDARWAAMNAADSMAHKIRYDTTYNPVIYSIGLQGNEPMAIDQDFMERMANDPRASNFDSTRPQGQFILATNPAELSQAFQQVASQILRLSK
jgi:Flp pilus assembly protein TadG